MRQSLRGSVASEPGAGLGPPGQALTEPSLSPRSAAAALAGGLWWPHVTEAQQVGWGEIARSLERHTKVPDS